MASTTDAPVDATGSENHLPESHTGEGVTMRPNAASEEASDAVPADSVSVKQSSTAASATAATEGNTLHIDLDLTSTTTEIEVASLNLTDEERQIITAETSNVPELSIEDLLRQAGWESRGPPDPPQGTTLRTHGSASGTAPPPKSTTAQQTQNEAKTGGSKTPSQPDKSRATGPPTSPPSSGRKGQPAAQDNSKKNDSKKNDSKKTTNSTA